jgi:hypothetical protein
MCADPGTLFAIATAASGALSSIASYSAEQSQYAAQMQAYRASEQAYAQQVKFNQEAANRAYTQEQLKLKGEYDKAAQQAKELMVSSLQSQGTILASGRTGQSIGALVGDAQRVYGTNMGNLAANLAYTNLGYGIAQENTFINAQSAMNSAAANRMVKPTKPGAMGLVLGLAQAAVSGYGAAMGAKAPAAGSGGGGGTMSVYNYQPSAGFNMPTGTGFNYSGGISNPSLPGNPYTYKR